MPVKLLSILALTSVACSAHHHTVRTFPNLDDEAATVEYVDEYGQIRSTSGRLYDHGDTIVVSGSNTPIPKRQVLSATVTRRAGSAVLGSVAGAALGVGVGILLVMLEGVGDFSNCFSDFADFEDEGNCRDSGPSSSTLMLASIVGTSAAGAIFGAARGSTTTYAMAQSAQPHVFSPPTPVVAADLNSYLLIPLPEIPCDPQTLRYAQQLRSLARANRCSAAAATSKLIRERDSNYWLALQQSPVWGQCPVR